MSRKLIFALAPAFSLLMCASCAEGKEVGAANTSCQVRIDEADLIAARKSAPEADEIFEYAGQKGIRHKIFVFRAEVAGSEHKLPSIVLFHGGGWNEGKATQFFRQARFLAGRGYVVFLPEYGLTSDGLKPVDSMKDAASAWITIRSKAGEYNLALDQMSAGGGSAGGHLAATLAMDTPLRETPILPKPNALILFNPVIDNGPDGYGHSRVSAYWRNFSPLHNIAGDHPDTLFMVGDSDDYVPVATARRYCKLVGAKGAACELFVDPGQKHTWFNGPGFQTTLRLTTEFLDRRFDPAGTCR
ncbi:MAG: alpha/beta hydrolase [Sphingomonadaceae bacterium]|nr:alpha/beta hydrolase [Sphingomonadaceae bacterium]